MTGTSVLKLKVDDKEYNASLKQAQQGMQHLEQALKGADKSFTQVDKSVVDYVRGIGKMEAQCKTARGRISEMSSAFIELSLQYKNMSDEVKSSDVGKALSESMAQLKQRTIEAKNELEGLNREIGTVKMPEMKGGGDLFSGVGDKMSGMLEVFGGNMMTKAAEAVSNLGSEMVEMIHDGVELAKQGEGIRIAFERLGRGDILQGLREATHGTVTDLELMKAAVKFDDFKLPVEELGTMLAFAQQKAKDTGQSIDYMVDSIVTGLGRKSLMILDNLGLSAADIKEKMKDTGDMTKAVGAIIREQMSQAGDYIETAADRAARANVDLQNKMEELGRKFAPVEEASNQLWTSMKLGILDVIEGPLMSLLNYLNQASRTAEDLITGSLPEVGSNVDENGNYIKRPSQKGAAGFDWEKGVWKPGYSGPIYNGATGQVEMPEVTITAPRREKHTLSRSTPKKDDIEKLIEGGIPGLKEIDIETKGATESMRELQGALKYFKDQLMTATTAAEYQSATSGIASTERKIAAQPMALKFGMDAESMADIQEQMEAFGEELRSKIKPIKIPLSTEKTGEVVKDAESIRSSMSQAAGAISSVGSALQQIEDPGAKVAGIVATAIGTVASSFAQALGEDKTTKGNIWAFIAASAASTAAMITMISQINRVASYSEGGMIKGSSYSGDNIMGNGGSIGVNAGEIILNKAQQGNLVSQMHGGAGTLRPSYISGEQIFVVLNRYLTRSGHGELVTWQG